MDYKDVEASLQTGDVLLFGATYEESEVIEQLTGVPFSHCGMVARFPDLDNKVYFWEAVDASRAFMDPIDKLSHFGARVVELRPLLSYYTPYTNNQFTWRRLQAVWTPALQTSFENFVKATDDRPFPSVQQMLINYVLGHYRNVNTGTDVMYCAQLVAATYQALGLLPLDPPTNYFAPADFSALAQRVPMLNGASLGPDTVVVFTGETKKNPVSIAALNAQTQAAAPATTTGAATGAAG
jgi:hypothetical protein